MKINNLEFVPDEDHDWIHILNEETNEHFRFNENSYSKIDNKFGKLVHQKIVNGFWKVEEVKVESIEKSTLYDFLKEFIDRKQFKEFIKYFMKYSPCIQDSKIELLLKDFAIASFGLGVNCEVNPYLFKNIESYL